MDCQLQISNVAAKINPINWTYSKKNKFPRVSDSGVLKGQGEWGKGWGKEKENKKEGWR